MIHELQNNTFAKEVIEGLSATKKHIPSKYLYDINGVKIFDQITLHPDYYLTRAEFNILMTYKKLFGNIFQINNPFNLVEFGPGDGSKAEILVSQFIFQHLNFTYCPIDISQNYLDNIHHQFKLKFPTLPIQLFNEDYLNGLKLINNSKPKLVLFLGSSIGNLMDVEIQHFLSRCHSLLQKGDYILIGFDLQKDIHIINKAYNDSAGLTKKFYLNVLIRMNRELNTELDLESFYPYSNYNTKTHAVESYLISKKHQFINIDNRRFELKINEPIHLENSFKYTDDEIKRIAKKNKFKVINNFFDPKKYFVNSLWKVE